MSKPTNSSNSAPNKIVTGMGVPLNAGIDFFVGAELTKFDDVQPDF